jgi:hypothetical protein
METQTVVEYEVIEPVSNKRLFTKDYDKASEHYERGCMVYETHKTKCQPTPLTQTRVYVTVRWNHKRDSEGDPT